MEQRSRVSKGALNGALNGAPKATRGARDRARGGLLSRLASLVPDALPDAWGQRLQTAARDARWVRRQLAGEAPRPFTEFARGARAAGRGEVRGAARVEPAASEATEAQRVTVLRDGKTYLAMARPGQTVLEAGLEAGAEMAFSCTVGGCGTCRVRLVSGRVEMSEPNCLSDEERREGYVLACVSRPEGAVSVRSEGE